MGTELTISEQRLPDVRRPENLSKLPPWAQERCVFLKKDHQPDRRGVWREVPVLPANLILTKPQRVEAEKVIAKMDVAVGMTPLADMAYAADTTTTVLKMTMVLPSRETGDLAAEAKGEAYMAALEDVPAWAVKEAIRKWYRKECGEKHDYTWQPGPPTLREIAMIEVYRVRAARRSLSELLAAEPVRVFSAAHEARMREVTAEHLRMKRA